MKKLIRIKIITMGNAEVGKSCLVKRYCEKRFVNKYQQTIGIDYGVTRARVGDRDIKVNIFDFGGHSAFMEVRNEFYKDAQVYDVSDLATFRALENWLAELKREYGDSLDLSKLACVVCANKSDKRRVISESEGRNWAEQRGFRYYETSAMNGTAVEEVFQTLFQGVISVLEGVPIQLADTTNKMPQYSKEQLDAIARVRAASDNSEKLGVRRGASRDEVNRAYRKLAVLLHPDKTGGAPGSEEAFKMLVAARADLLRAAVG